jgi:hypothetical protein
MVAMIESKGHSTWTAFLVGLVLLAGLAMAFAMIVPIIECPDCHLPPDWISIAKVSLACERCQGRNRVSLVNRWLKGPGPFRN